jgi:hypothetical protein
MRKDNIEGAHQYAQQASRWRRNRATTGALPRPFPFVHHRGQTRMQSPRNGGPSTAESWILARSWARRTPCLLYTNPTASIPSTRGRT